MFASGQLKEGEKYDVDFNHQFIETELYDAKPTYKKFSSYRPGVKERNVSSMITYGYDTAYCLKSHCGVRGCRRQKGCFSLNLSDNSVMRGRVHARRTLKGLVADLRDIF